MSTTSATQAMFLMNNEFVYQAASEAAFPIGDRKNKTDVEEKIRHVFLSVLGREPAELERDWARGFIQGFEAERDVILASPVEGAEPMVGGTEAEMRVAFGPEEEAELAKTIAPWTMLYHALFETAEFRFLR